MKMEKEDETMNAFISVPFFLETKSFLGSVQVYCATDRDINQSRDYGRNQGWIMVEIVVGMC